MIKYLSLIPGMGALANSAFAHDLPAVQEGPLHELLHFLPFGIAFILCLIIAKIWASKSK